MVSSVSRVSWVSRVSEGTVVYFLYYKSYTFLFSRLSSVSRDSRVSRVSGSYMVCKGQRRFVCSTRASRVSGVSRVLARNLFFFLCAQFHVKLYETGGLFFVILAQK